MNKARDLGLRILATLLSYRFASNDFFHMEMLSVIISITTYARLCFLLVFAMDIRLLECAMAEIGVEKWRNSHPARNLRTINLRRQQLEQLSDKCN